MDNSIGHDPSLKSMHDYKCSLSSIFIKTQYLCLKHGVPYHCQPQCPYVWTLKEVVASRIPDGRK